MDLVKDLDEKKINDILNTMGTNEQGTAKD